MHVAKKTLEAIERELTVDGGARWRGLLRECMMELEDAYRDKNESFRSHMGASQMASVCARAIWYNFHWTTKPAFTGRIQRLFNRGHMEEGRFVALLRLIGVRVFQFDANGKQYRISGSFGHYGGSGDGIGIGVPDLPESEPCVLEFKTHNDKSFSELIKKGVREAKPEHYGQMQQYLRKFDIRFALYMAVNKNNDEIYAEVVATDQATADQLIERADKIIWMKRAPERIGRPPSPGLLTCRWCDHRPVCHLKAAPDRNCRTCSHSAPIQSEDNSGVWHCWEWKCAIPKDAQEAGCERWEKHPDMGA